MERKNEKEINCQLYYQSLQIRKGIEGINFDCESLYSGTNIDGLILLENFYSYCPTKLKVVYGNNLALSLFPLYVSRVLKDFINTSYSLNTNETKFTLSLLNVLWNSTDCSEKLVDKLLDISNFKEYISVIIRKTDYSNDTGYSIVTSAISVVNNVVRREPFRLSFDGYDISDRIFDILSLERTDQNYKLAFTYMICFIFPWSNETERNKLIDQFKENILIYLNGVSSTSNYRYESFSSIELLEMVKVSCRHESVKKFYLGNPTLESTIISFLSKSHQIDLVMSIISLLYTQQTIQKLEALYIVKNGNSNTKVLQHFKKLKNTSI